MAVQYRKTVFISGHMNDGRYVDAGADHRADGTVCYTQREWPDASYRSENHHRPAEAAAGKVIVPRAAYTWRRIGQLREVLALLASAALRRELDSQVCEQERI